MAETVEQIIRRVAGEVGVDPDLAIAVARQESGLNPRAHNPNGEDSWGLFQGNRRGGMGSGYTPEQLMDPEFNARLMLSAMARTQKATGLTGGQLAAASQRPADPQGYARSVNAMLSGGRGLPHTGSPFNPQGAPTMASDTAMPNQLTSGAGAQRSGPSLAPSTLAQLRAKADRLQAEIDRLESGAGGLDPYTASERKADLERQHTSVLTQIGAEENRVRDDGKTSRRTQVVGNNLVDLDTGRVITSLPAEARNRRTQVVGTKLIDLDNGDVIADLSAALAKAEKPGTTTASGFVYPNDPETGLPRTDQGVDVRTDAQRETERLALEDQRYKAGYASFMGDLDKQIADGRLTPQEAMQKRQTFITAHQSRAEQLQSEQETRLRAQSSELTTGYRHDYTTGQQLLENGQPVKTLAQQEKERAARTSRAAELSKQSGYMTDPDTGEFLYDSTGRRTPTEDTRQKRGEEQRQAQGMANDLTDRVTLGAMASNGGPVRPGTSTLNMPNVPGDPSMSIGERILRQKGVWPADEPMLTAEERDRRARQGIAASQEGRAIAGAASELGSNAAMSAIYRGRGANYGDPNRPATQPSTVGLPGDAGESVGMRLLKKFLGESGAEVGPNGQIRQVATTAPASVAQSAAPTLPPGVAALYGGSTPAEPEENQGRVNPYRSYPPQYAAA